MLVLAVPGHVQDRSLPLCGMGWALVGATRLRGMVCGLSGWRIFRPGCAWPRPRKTTAEREAAWLLNSLPRQVGGMLVLAMSGHVKKGQRSVRGAEGPPSRNHQVIVLIFHQVVPDARTVSRPPCIQGFRLNALMPPSVE